MNRLLKVIVYVAAALIFAIVYAVSASVLGIETSGSIGTRVVHNAITMLLGWGSCLIFLKLNGAKITWPN